MRLQIFHKVLQNWFISWQSEGNQYLYVLEDLFTWKLVSLSYFFSYFLA